VENSWRKYELYLRSDHGKITKIITKYRGGLPFSTPFLLWVEFSSLGG
jgi:hypothetical protein